jgi:NAD(P)-dependent dehydrogenase (short-subunit alcohol dehydrogenase family)
MLERLMKVNTYGPIYAMRKAVKTFLKQESAGNIINVTSVGADHNTAGAAYAASKAAVWAVSRNTTFQYHDKGIRCNCIAPGGIATEISKSMGMPNMAGFGNVKKLLAVAPDMGSAEDIANAALYLASDESGYVNGTVITVDGGWTCL